eukprot:1151347-Pelagomonas_calceolata.AAC.7
MGQPGRPPISSHPLAHPRRPSTAALQGVQLPAPTEQAAAWASKALHKPACLAHPTFLGVGHAGKPSTATPQGVQLPAAQITLPACLAQPHLERSSCLLGLVERRQSPGHLH